MSGRDEPGITRNAAATPAAAGTGAALVVMEDVRFTWPGRRAFSIAVDRFTLARGERVLIVGPSGGGKSTVLGLLCGTLKPQSGRITILGTDIAQLSAAARDRFRADHIGIVFQMFNLLPYGSVIDNVVLPLAFGAGRRARLAGGDGRGEASRLLSRLGIDVAELGGERASSLSVGQQQRVAAARALIAAPELIVADEPTSSLDRDRQRDFLNLLFAEIGTAGSTLVMVSHDRSLGAMFDRTVELDSFARGSTGEGP